MSPCFAVAEHFSAKHYCAVATLALPIRCTSLRFLAAPSQFSPVRHIAIALAMLYPTPLHFADAELCLTLLGRSRTVPTSALPCPIDSLPCSPCRCCSVRFTALPSHDYAM